MKFFLTLVLLLLVGAFMLERKTAAKKEAEKQAQLVHSDAQARAAVRVTSWPELVLSNGQRLKQVTLRNIEADGLRLEHLDGVGKVRFQDLPPDVQYMYHYNPNAANNYVATQTLSQALAQQDKIEQVNAKNAELQSQLEAHAAEKAARVEAEEEIAANYVSPLGPSNDKTSRNVSRVHGGVRIVPVYNNNQRTRTGKGGEFRNWTTSDGRPQ